MELTATKEKAIAKRLPKSPPDRLTDTVNCLVICRDTEKLKTLLQLGILKTTNKIAGGRPIYVASLPCYSRSGLTFHRMFDADHAIAPEDNEPSPDWAISHYQGGKIASTIDFTRSGCTQRKLWDVFKILCDRDWTYDVNSPRMNELKRFFQSVKLQFKGDR